MSSLIVYVETRGQLDFFYWKEGQCFFERHYQSIVNIEIEREENEKGYHDDTDSLVYETKTNSYTYLEYRLDANRI